MLIGYLSHLEFCREVSDPQVLQLINKSYRAFPDSPSEHYFFPALVRLDAPSEVWESNSQFKYSNGWILQCSRPEQFFSLRFLQVLILRLAFTFALIPSAKEIDEQFPALQRKCSVWKNGLFWGNRHGVEALVEVLNNHKAVVLSMHGREGNVVECVTLRSQVIKQIKLCCQDFCTTTVTHEILMNPSAASRYLVFDPFFHFIPV